MITAPTIAAGQACLIRIAVRVHGTGEARINYMGTAFTLRTRKTIERLPDNMEVIELPAVVEKSTGRASYLVSYQGHSLRVHAQQIHPIEEVPCE